MAVETATSSPRAAAIAHPGSGKGFESAARSEFDFGRQLTERRPFSVSENVRPTEQAFPNVGGEVSDVSVGCLEVQYSNVTSRAILGRSRCNQPIES